MPVPLSRMAIHMEGEVRMLFNQRVDVRRLPLPPPRPIASMSRTMRSDLDENVRKTTDALDGERDKLLVIHNMGQGCRYCTLWADGFNGLLPHLEDALAVALVSKDPPSTQRNFANSRGWRFRMASHGGGAYIRDQGVFGEAENYPGTVVYERAGDAIRRKNACVFGPGDIYCALWPFLGMAGMDGGDWTPQFDYWTRPERLDDGGANVRD